MMKISKQLLMSGLILFGSAVTISAAEKKVNKNKVYVSANGKDTYTGTFDRPFATVNKAREALKGKKGFKTIILKEGNHRIRETINVENEDSPDLLNSLCILGVGKSKVTISGEKIFKPSDLRRVKWKSGTKGKAFRNNIYNLILTDCSEEELAVFKDNSRKISDLIIDGTRLERVIAPDSATKVIDFAKLFTDYNQYVFDKFANKIFFSTDAKIHPFTKIRVPLNISPLVKVNDTSYFRIENISFKNNQSDGLIVEQSNNFKMKNCLFDNITGQKVSIDNAEVVQESGQLTVKENEADNILVDCIVN